MGKKEGDTPTTWRGWLMRSLRGLVVYSVWLGVTVGLLAVGVYGLWRYVRPHVVTGPHFRLDTEQIVLQPAPPAWIRGDIRAEVIRSASLDEQSQWSILDDDLAGRLYRAFSLHPWIARVEKVVKLNPAGVRVEVAYRRAVCMVEVPGGLYAVDADGYLLPSSDFSAEDVKSYPRLAGVHTTTEGPVGTQWQDPHVLGAARVAETIIDAWSELGLVRIAPTPAEARLVAKREEYDLFTNKGTCIHWGTADDQRQSGEPSLADKLQRLREFAKTHGSLDDSAGPRILDVRQGTEVTSQPLADAPSQAAAVIPVARKAGEREKD